MNGQLSSCNVFGGKSEVSERTESAGAATGPWPHGGVLFAHVYIVELSKIKARPG